ncbi:lysophospholipase L1-like esterase [Neobacillus bataviensis LMG 21833]|uniref:Lysophospholipase L1-like esterase n=1 Tax=Neobacillus bataviensis LMG 21833 TaxID=1117379 RepID=K6CHW5_9BACI|nr:SGNH/GDSL hydrolase family protein [Neobacillus bataviensis]EKN70735.1 lysophospholipase L1-like esterase [Neobacillus bataviensis LMG 21833]
MNKNVIRSITAIAVLFCLLWLIGLGWAVGEYYAGKPEKVPETTTVNKKVENKKGLTIVALGDSLTRGTGDETGKGYVGVLMDEIKEKSKRPVQLTNLGINGQRSDQLRKQVQQTEIGRQIQKADMVLVTIGGNDLFRGGQGLADFKTEDIVSIEKKYLDNLKFTFEQIRKNNKKANVFFIGLYNPFIELDQGKEMSKVIRQWNYDSAEVSAVYPKIVFVPTFDLFELKVNDYLYSDKFHPNSKGYRLIAERVASLLTW